MSSVDFDRILTSLGLGQLSTSAQIDATFVPDQLTGSSPSIRATPLAELAPRRPVLPTLTLGAPGGEREELVAVGVLGEGGMGQVLLARQLSLDREVAVKIPRNSGGDPRASAALLDEARISGSLEHPGVIPIYALAHDIEGRPALVMKRVDGVSWLELFYDAEHPMWQHVAQTNDRLQAHLEILVSVCNAVAHAHQRGVIHRDLKPANVLIGELGEIYVADWGIAAHKTDLAGGPIRLLGTPAYLAPEMVTGDSRLTDERTDVYLLGATLYELLVGHAPHLAPTLAGALEKAFVSARAEFPPTVPTELAELCRTAMAADPRERFQSVLELRDALRLYVELRGASRLVRTAELRFASLEAMSHPHTEGDSQRWYTLLTECRFAFSQAMEAFPLNFDAQAGLEKCLRLAIEREVQLKNAGSARAFLAELRAINPHAAPISGFEALERQDSERAATEARLRNLEHDLSPIVGVRQRRLITTVLLVAIVGVGGIAVLLEQLGGERKFGIWERPLPLALVLLAYLLGVTILRTSLLSTRLNRQMTFISGVHIGGLMVVRVFGILLAVPFATAMTFEALAIAGMTAMTAFIWHWSMVIPAGIFLLSAVGCLLLPEHARQIFSVGAVLAVISEIRVLSVWTRQHRTEKSAQP